ncbi:transcription regulator protein BACH1 [Ambystoma mexicanum]|uniref:transcription regulator protein BACH1 n=1 Tax=Ambystoma mexicanum TaxID=8296 RepID=UPI0037E7AF19
MSASDQQNVDFAYESTVHCSDVLLRLNDQRKQDLLCDVTVQVEEERFRAHRSVLAACSDYLQARIVSQLDADLVIILPEQVTVKGFGPLLQFAYTAKLLLNNDNVLDVSKCADILGMRNIESSCFHFLKLKFMGNKSDQQDVSGKKSSKPLCKKVDQAIPCDDPPGSNIDERVKDLMQNEQALVPCCKLRKFQDPNSSAFTQVKPEPSCRNICTDRENISFVCNKYKQFQQAFKEDCIQCPMYMPNVPCASAETTLLSESFGNPSLQNDHGNTNNLVGISTCEECPVKMEGKVFEDEREFIQKDAYQSVDSSVENIDNIDSSSFSSQSSADTHGFLTVPFPSTYEQYNSVSITGVQSNIHAPMLNGTILASTEIQNELIDNQSSNYSQQSNSCAQEEISLGTDSRSNVEREVAEHLAKGFWPDIYSTETACRPQLSTETTKEFSDQIYQDKKSECPWLGITITDSPERTFTNLNSVNCPFISTLATEAFSNSSDLSGSEYVQDQQQDKFPYDGVIDDSETDTEGDSESCSAREQEYEVKLPFSARRIVSLSRNDFQSLLKVHKLTNEQLDCIHDIRRRSKNRIAAQRCRKRKLDCIQNLETEIEKLQYEKDSLLKERDHILSTLGDTKNNLTELCQQVCLEAALSQEQIQILAKYSASECPLSFLVPEKEQMQLSECVSMVPSCIGFPDAMVNKTPAAVQTPGIFERKKNELSHIQMQEYGPLSQRSSENTVHVEHCVQSGITDFCRQMTDKCTTDELH